LKNKNLLLLLLVIFFYSCNCVETHLTVDEKSWFSVYEKGQKIIFKSNRGNIDTIEVAEKIETHGNKDCNWIEMGRIQEHIMYIELKTKVCHNYSYCDAEISISKDSEDKNAFPSFRIFGLYFSKLYQKIEPQIVSVKLVNSNKIYSSTYHFESGVNADGYGIDCPKSFYWDKNEGLIKYELNDGEVFELLKKIN